MVPLKIRKLLGLLRLLRINEPRSHMVILCGVFLAIGTTLVFQPARYGNTPAYANLLAVFSAVAWGHIYLMAALLQVVCLWKHTRGSLVVVTHTVVIILISMWLFSFLFRYVTDDGTTIVNVASWTTYLYLAIRSAILVDDRVKTGAGE